MSENNYVVYHLHSQISNAVTNIDSVTPFEKYVELAKTFGMKAMAFSEHGSCMEWKHKKDAIESAGMKYIHAEEFYITKQLYYPPNDLEEFSNNIPDSDCEKKEKIENYYQEHKYCVRDNYHCILIAKNYEGFKELNRLSSKSFNHEDGHFYYNPRITFDELINTSENIIITTACVAGLLGKGEEELKNKFLDFLCKNKERCFLEVQHHNTEKQRTYNKYLYELSKKFGLKLIAATDTHCLNEEHELGRKMMQEAKGVLFDGEDGWDLKFKSYEQLVECFKVQSAIPEEAYMEAIENTNKLADLVEPIQLDTSFKFPKLYNNSKEMLREKLFNENVINSIKEEGFSEEEIISRMNEEMETFEALNSIDYILLIDYIIQWAHKNDIWCGPARGSAASSLALYALGVTEVNPLKHGFKFWRFMSKDKYSLPDVDTDWGGTDRDKAKYWMLHDKLNLQNIQTAEIITFNTIALKGAIRDIGRGLKMPLEEVDEIAKAVHDISDGENKITVIDDYYREKYPKLFYYVDIVQGTITSVGSHPSGILVTDKKIAEELGFCYIKGDDYPVCVLDMKELDTLNYVKEDVLGLDNVSIINNTCKIVGIDRLKPRNVDLEDDKVWDSIKEDTSLLFQVNSNYGARTVSKMYSPQVYEKIKKQIPNITRFDLLAYISALIRPCGKNVYSQVVEGNAKKTGIEEIDNLLGPEMGYPILQETQMEFVQKFCGYSFLESDKLRKAVAKKKGTKEQLPKIKKGFEENAKVRFGLSKEQSDDIINPFMQCVLDATRYAFGRAHDYSYTYISYECAWLRYYYPLQYLTSCFNVADTDEKIAEASGYAERHKIKIVEPKFRHSKSEYFFDLDSNCIYKGINSVKYLNSNVADVLYSLRENKYDNFIQLLYDIKNTGIDSRQIQVLIKLDFFSEFGNAKKLMRIYNIFTFFKSGEAKSIFKAKVTDTITSSIISRHSTETEKKYNNLDCSSILNEMCQYIDTQDIEDFDYKIKIQDELEYLGYISLKTEKTEDRPKLIILDKKNMISKFGKDIGKPWAVNIQAQSIGSGIKNEFTIMYSEYKKCPFEKDDIILVDPRCVEKNNKGYWYIKKYEKVI